MKKFGRISTLSIVATILFVAILWQVDYELEIRRIRKTCPDISQRQRLKYTPVLMYKFLRLTNATGVKNDRLIYNAAIYCSSNNSSGYYFEYMAHIYIAEQEQQELLNRYESEHKK